MDNPLVNSRGIFWLTTDKEGKVIRSNRAWIEHFPHIHNATAIIVGNYELPDFDRCDFTAPPLELTLKVRHNETEYTSKWYVSSHDGVNIDVVGFLCTTSTLADNEKIEHFLFTLNHVIMQPICHVKGLTHLLITSPSLAGQIVPKLQQSCDKIEEIINYLSRLK